MLRIRFVLETITSVTVTINQVLSSEETLTNSGNLSLMLVVREQMGLYLVGTDRENRDLT